MNFDQIDLANSSFERMDCGVVAGIFILMIERQVEGEMLVNKFRTLDWERHKNRRVKVFEPEIGHFLGQLRPIAFRYRIVKTLCHGFCAHL